jgi:hypothetical protein
MQKTSGQSRNSRRMGTKAPHLCSKCNRRIKPWKWMDHQKRHIKDMGLVAA